MISADLIAFQYIHDDGIRYSCMALAWHGTAKPKVDLRQRTANGSEKKHAEME